MKDDSKRVDLVVASLLHVAKAYKKMEVALGTFPITRSFCPIKSNHCLRLLYFSQPFFSEVCSSL